MRNKNGKPESGQNAHGKIAIDLCCGLGGWTEGLIRSGYQVFGFDIENHSYPGHVYPGQLILQDILTIHGSQFKNAALPPELPSPVNKGKKIGGDWFSDSKTPIRKHSHNSVARKRGQALIAKIPFELSIFIGEYFA